MYVTPVQASANAQMLAHEIALLVREARMQRPELTWGETWMALALARQSLSQESGTFGRRAQIVAGLATTILALVGGILAFLMSAQ